MDDEIKIIIRDIKIDIILDKYKCISAYKIPNDVEKWLKCPNCGLYPLTWEFNNGSSTGCGCGKNEYDKFSIYTESVISYGKRNNFNFTNYDSDKLRKNWNHWVLTNEELEKREDLLSEGKW